MSSIFSTPSSVTPSRPQGEKRIAEKEEYKGCHYLGQEEEMERLKLKLAREWEVVRWEE
jgi:hypothetical protein